MRLSIELKNLAKCLLLASIALMLGCSEQKDPNNLTSEQLGEPNFHTNTLIVATDWGPKTFEPLLKAFELEQKVSVRLLGLDELAAIKPAERPVVDLYLLGSLQALSSLKTEDLQFVQPKASIRLQSFAATGETPWVMLGYWPLLSASNTALSSDLGDLTQRSVDPLCAPERQVRLITAILEGSGFLADPEAGLSGDPTTQITPDQSEIDGGVLETSGSAMSPENDAQGFSEAPIRSLIATRLNLTQALASLQCSSVLFFDNNQFAVGSDERERASFVRPILIDGPVAAVPKDATNPLKALWMIEWLLGVDQQQQLSDKYQTHTVLTSQASPAKEDQEEPRLVTAESVEWASLSAQAAP